MKVILKDMVEQLLNVTKDVTGQRDNALIEQFQGLDQIDFREWMDHNMAKVRTWPEAVQALVRAKWEITQGTEVYPLTA